LATVPVLLWHCQLLVGGAPSEPSAVGGMRPVFSELYNDHCTGDVALIPLMLKWGKYRAVVGKWALHT
jgi:hypothetical protein